MTYLQMLQCATSGYNPYDSASAGGFRPTYGSGARARAKGTAPAGPAGPAAPTAPAAPLPNIVFDCPVPAYMADDVTNVLQTLYDKGVDLNNCHVEAVDQEVFFPGGNYHYRSIKLTVAGHTIELSADLAGKYPEVAANEILSMMGRKQG